MSAALAGAGMGLGLGAAYLAAGLGQQAADHQRAVGIAAAAVSGYDAGAAPATGRSASQASYDHDLRTDAFRDRPAAAKPARARELDCLTQAVYYEARGESPQGQFAVAQVVLNRVKHPAFPKSVCGVVFQGAGRRTGCQFSFACDGSKQGRRESAAWTRARKVAARALSGAAIAEIGSATHFHTTAVAPAWGPQMRRVAQVGMHVFYRFAPRRSGQPMAAPAPALAEAVVMIASPGEAAPELKLVPAVLEAPAAETPPPAPVDAPPADAKPAQPPQPKPAEAAALTAPPPAAAGVSARAPAPAG